MAKPTKKIRPPSSSSQVSFERLAHFLICLCIVLYALYAGSSFFIPITYGLFFSLMLKPVCHRFECNLPSRILSVILTLFSAGFLVLGVLVFFINQVREILTEADDIFSGLQETIFEWAEYGGGRFGLSGSDVEEYIDQAITSVSDQPFGILSSGLSTSGVLLANFGLVMIYTFFFLLYRTPIKNFLLGQLQRDDQTEGLQTLTEVQQVAKSYLGGMGLVMLILGVLNSLGLFAIGIDYYLVWGFLAAILAVIPYIGTVIGGLLPFVFAIATTETFWQPVAVVLLYITVQFIEGNFITPKVLGNSVKINALAAIMVVLLGSVFWGIAGVILAIPLLAMVRIVLTHIEPLRPVALLLSDDLYEESGKFLDDFNEPRYRLSNIFSGKSSLSLLTRRRTTSKPSKRKSHSDTQVVADPET
ncbi:AI-2E family transporter [Lewinella sp. IMCC34183]|uniref:AI-2E family transporter n=1 Tax=Lewinella sp. IMCC34183 TaxID=2248762 RepID=UPI000E25BDB8|nr:AI-2E family transporter [Lewinella sp. IMCC34183]